MYRFSRAIYRELADEIAEDPNGNAYTNHERVLRACEAAIERLATDRHYFARPARSLFQDIRPFFPMCSQRRVLAVVERYMEFADEFLRHQPQNGFDIYGCSAARRPARARPASGCHCHTTATAPHISTSLIPRSARRWSSRPKQKHVRRRLCSPRRMLPGVQLITSEVCPIACWRWCAANSYSVRS